MFLKVLENLSPIMLAKVTFNFTAQGQGGKTYLPIASSYGHFVLYSCVLGPYHHHHQQVNIMCTS